MIILMICKIIWLIGASGMTAIDIVSACKNIKNKNYTWAAIDLFFAIALIALIFTTIVSLI